ncbi:hypothetical protein ACVXG7_13800 [Enterobacter hormaechei]
MAADAPERVNGLTLISVNPLPVAPDALASRREAVRTAQAQGLADWLVSSLWQSYVAPSRLSIGSCKRLFAEWRRVRH